MIDESVALFWRGWQKAGMQWKVASCPSPSIQGTARRQQQSASPGSGSDHGVPKG